MSISNVLPGMFIWAGFLLGCLVADAVSPMGVASGLLGAFLISISCRGLGNFQTSLVERNPYGNE